LDQFQKIIEKLETHKSHHNSFINSLLMTADKAKTLFDLGIDEEVIKEQPNDYTLIKEWVSDQIKIVREKLCGTANLTNTS